MSESPAFVGGAVKETPAVSCTRIKKTGLLGEIPPLGGGPGAPESEKAETLYRNNRFPDLAPGRSHVRASGVRRWCREGEIGSALPPN